GDHELLDVHVGVGVRPAVEDVHHRHRQQVGVRAADVAEQGQVGALGGGAGRGQGDPQDGVGAELALVRAAVQVDQGLVQVPLVGGVQAEDLRGDGLGDGGDGVLHALAEVARLVTVAALDCLEGTGGCTGGNGCPGERSVIQGELDLHGRVAARVEDLACTDGLDTGHIDSLLTSSA